VPIRAIASALQFQQPRSSHEASAQTVMALPLPTDAAPAVPKAPHVVEGTGLAAHRIKRCNYRRLISLERPKERVYEVECLYPRHKLPIPLGDLDSAMPICNACTAAHIFRADED
jgi:hypothetical protein